ncbi:PASTA domain-containing protein [Nocardioides sp. WV_118_6]
MSDELSEERARVLLARAAATIDVDPAAPADPQRQPQSRPHPHRRGLGLLAGAAAAVAAVAAVVLIVGLVVLVGRAGDDRPQPAGPDGRPVEREHRYDDDRMPPLLGAEVDPAVAELEGRGLKVRVSERREGCWPVGVVTRTNPGPGQPVAAGAEVRLQVTVPINVVDCVGEPDSRRALELLRFARGWGDLPRLASRVEVSVIGGPAGEVDGADLRDPQAPAWTLCEGGGGTCHAAPALLRELSTRTPADLGAGARLPAVRVGHGRPGCAPDEMRGFVTVDRAAGTDLCPVEAVWWTTDGEGRITAIAMTVLPPQAQAAPRPDRVREAAADRFVAWARGTGPAPAFADRVRNMLGGGDHFGAPRWNDRPDERGSWAGCSGLGFPDCGIDPIATILHFTGDVAVAAGRAACGTSGPLPSSYAAATGDIVRLFPRGARCEGWQVELWIDARGRVYGVNLS